MNDTQQSASNEFGIGILQSHEKRLFQLIQTVLASPINHYIDRDGRPDRELISQQLSLRSTLVLNLSNQVGRLQLALYSLAVQNLGVDFGAILNEMADAQESYESAMDDLMTRITGGLPIAPESVVETAETNSLAWGDDLADLGEGVVGVIHNDGVVPTPKVGDGVYQG